MFKNYDEITQGLLQRLSANALLNLDDDNYLKNILENDPALWTELCQYHYKITPASDEDPQQRFGKQFHIQKKQQAPATANKDDFNTTAELIHQHIKARHFPAALTLAQQLVERYGAPGHMLALYCHQEQLAHATDPKEQQAIAKQAGLQLYLAELTMDSSKSVLKEIA